MSVLSTPRSAARAATLGPLVLVGMRCSGKSTIGSALAARLGLAFVDLDEETLRFGRYAGLRSPSVGELMASAGAARFRDFEATALRKLLEPAPGVVIAAGGGVVEREDNRTWLERTATVVFLAVPPEVLRARMAADRAPRPALLMADPLGEIEAVLAQREPLYRSVADVVIEAGDAPPEELVRRIEAALPGSALT